MFLLKPLFDCFCWSAARLPHSTSCCRGRCSIASLDRLLLALVLKHACAEALAVRSLSIPNRWAVPLITAGSCQSRDLILKIQQPQPEAQYTAENANWK